ncbi:MAG: hypothetical protein GTN69_10515 [Armatimonadetes bacterium]|nr:hypothetical protein [Armatimonadota bacterium]
MNISFADEDWRKMSRLCKRLRPYQPVGTTLREILLHRFTGCKALEHGVKSCADGPWHAQDQDDTSRGSSSQKEEEGRKRRDTAKRARLQRTQAAERIVARINELRSPYIPDAKGFSTEPYLKEITTCLIKHTEDELLEVMQWMYDEAVRKNDWQWFVPDTMFRPTLFKKKLDKSRAGVKYGDNGHGRGQQAMFVDEDDPLLPNKSRS